MHKIRGFVGLHNYCIFNNYYESRKLCQNNDLWSQICGFLLDTRSKLLLRIVKNSFGYFQLRQPHLEPNCHINNLTSRGYGSLTSFKKVDEVHESYMGLDGFTYS